MIMNGAAHGQLELGGTSVPVAGAFVGARRHAGGYAVNRRRRLNDRIAAFIKGQATDEQAAQPAPPPATKRQDRHLDRTLRWRTRTSQVGSRHHRHRPRPDDLRPGHGPQPRLKVGKFLRNPGPAGTGQLGPALSDDEKNQS